MQDVLSNWAIVAQAVGPAREAAEQAPLMPGWLAFLIIVAMFAIPFALGILIARGLKLRDLSLKIGVVLFALELGLAPFVSQYVIGYFEQQRYERQLAQFREKEALYDITPENLERLRERNPDLQIVPRTPSDSVESRFELTPPVTE